MASCLSVAAMVAVAREAIWVAAVLDLPVTTWALDSQVTWEAVVDSQVIWVAAMLGSPITQGAAVPDSPVLQWEVAALLGTMWGKLASTIISTITITSRSS